jgi:glycosyltransferase involved in cell wall biosynthesis
MPYSLTALRQPENRGPAVARNRGWQTSRASVVCFTDDDCNPSRRWLAEMLAGLEHADVVQGTTLPNPGQEGNRGPFSHTLLVLNESGYYETCNMAYRRDVLERIGGFNEHFRYAYGEDTELAWRAKESGATTAFADRAVVYHDVTLSSWRAALRGVRRREGIVQTFRFVPGLRDRLGKGLFYEDTHLPAVAVTACMVALAQAPRSPRRWATSAAIGLWYARECRRVHAKPKVGNVGWFAVVPAALVLDLADFAVFVRSSVRYRTLQL